MGLIPRTHKIVYQPQLQRIQYPLLLPGMSAKHTHTHTHTHTHCVFQKLGKTKKK